MAEVKAFRALIYNQEKIKNISKVVCPPYDVISPSQQERYYLRDEHNFIRVLFAKETPGEDKYLRAGSLFRQWIKDNLLVHDANPALYFYSHQYTIKGEKRIRLGFIGLLHLGKGSASAYAHENTHVAPKEDRLRLLREVKANLSPLFIVFPDEKRIIQRMYRFVLEKKPFIDIIDEDRNEHKVWRLEDPEMLAAVAQAMREESIFIADGHHRYEVACAYRDEMSAKLAGQASQASPAVEADFNYVMAYFTNTESRGLTILPIHRLLALKDLLSLEAFKEKCQPYFDIEEIKEKTRFFFLMQKGGRSEHLIGIYKEKRFLILRLRNVKILDKMITDKPAQYKSLDVAILNYLVLRKSLGVDCNDQELLTFHPDALELLQRVDANPSYIAFFLNPVKVEQIMSVALSGNKMPPKSTFFYPKVLSGLVMNVHRTECGVNPTLNAKGSV